MLNWSKLIDARALVYGIINLQQYYRHYIDNVGKNMQELGKKRTFELKTGEFSMIVGSL